jgi:NADPH:quinone reductase-like Zn-dependent oxidoreductase
VFYASLNPVDAKWLMLDKIPKFLHSFCKMFMNGCKVGLDFSGVVVQASIECKFKPGDRVFGTAPLFTGSFAEYICVPTDYISDIPNGVSFEQAAAIPLVGLTIVQLFQRMPNVKSGSHILIIGGSGGTGHIAVQYAKIKGAIVTAVSL